MRSCARVSSDRRYRYWLARRWGRGPPLVWVLCNPSTADADRDDPTLRRCRGFSVAWGFGALVVVNLFALRASRPSVLAAIEPSEAVGRCNDAVLGAVVGTGWPLVAGWGNAGARAGRDQEIASRCPRGMLCLGRTRAGAPRHPLYVRADTEPVPFTAP